ncbi:hypothetical protein PIB30_044737, partial [Stylosanthes scabra]|nr:hypothetical protein [Stylosanthes scabra]
MKVVPFTLLALLFVAIVPNGLAVSSTVPAFLWSSHYDNGMKDSVNYQTTAPSSIPSSTIAPSSIFHRPRS